MAKTRNYAFFNHNKCEYFPCHKTDDPDNFNCLFCYCPLYVLGEKCGGNFRILKNGFKDCTECTFPHRRESYDIIMKRYMEVVEAMKRLNE